MVHQTCYLVLLILTYIILIKCGKKIAIMLKVPKRLRRYQFLKTTIKWNATRKVKAFLFIHRTMVVLLFFNNLSKIHFVRPIFFNFIYIKHLLLSMCIICTKGNKATANSGYTKACFTINIPFKMLLCHFRYFNFSNFNMTFVDKHIKKLRWTINF